jgi:iron(III) transport system ATP-binding protein
MTLVMRKVSVECRNIRLAYDRTEVLRDVSLRIEPGEFFALLGPSGSGKSTLLRLIAGFNRQQNGQLLVDGKDISAIPPHARNIGMVFQSYALWPHMTVYDNVAYGLKLRGLSKSDLQQRADTILAATKLSQLAQRYPGELSGGQQQRVSLARALVVEPETLLLDEPLSNLDANLREEMRFEIRRLHDKFRYTTVYVTHDQSEAMTAADMIVVMNQGVIEQAGTPEDIYQRPRTEFVARFIGGTNIFRGAWDRRDAVAAGNGLVLRCGSGDFAQQGDTAVSVRQHDVRLATTRPEGDTNSVQGTVARQIYLGSHRDYLVNLPDGESVRALAPAHVSIPPGESVWLHLPPEHCRALAH